MVYIVYKTTNLINGKYYVGVHRTNPDIFDGYIGCGVTKTDLKKKKLKGFPAAVKKYGYHNFKRETLFTFPDNAQGMKDAYAKEAEIVDEKFVKSNQTYNLTVGGKFTAYTTIRKKIAQYTLDGKFIRAWDSITEAQNSLNLNAISQCLTKRAKYCGDFQWRYFTNTKSIPAVTKSKTVYQFDLAGNLLRVWKSSSEASAIFKNSKAARVAIENVCANTARQVYGYYWSYKHIFNYQSYNRNKAIAMYDTKGHFLQSFTSIKDAAESLKIKSSGNIIAAIKGLQKTCKGYRWRYFYGNTANIKPL